MISIVVAASENNVIGKDNRLLWHLPEDLKFFKQQTLGKVIIMGRKTFESIGSRPLPKRTNVVITRSETISNPEVQVFHSLETAVSTFANEPETCIVGGEQIYRQALPFTDVVYLTRVHTTVDGDTFFPELDPLVWEKTAEDRREADEKHKFAYTFLTFHRKK